MKKSILPRHEIAEDDGFHQYLLDRPGLLLKMLDLAETWRKRRHTAGNADTPPPGTGSHSGPEHEHRKMLT